MLSNLYDQDYAAWLFETASRLRAGKLNAVDIANLAEELEDMGRSEKRAVDSNLEVLLRHLLKYQYQPQLRSNSWRFTILEHRDRLDKAFRDSLSLKPYYVSIFADAYHCARQKAAVETGLPLETFPVESPFTPEATLNPDFLPDSDRSSDR
jgi:hypothetical protein